MQNIDVKLSSHLGRIIQILSVFTLLVALQACSGTDAEHSEQNTVTAPQVSLKAKSISDRKYFVGEPKGFSLQKPYKLLLAFHGANGNGKRFGESLQLHTLSDEYVVVYPSAATENWNEGCQCNKPHRLGIDDLAFVDDVIADIKNQYSIADQEIYALGYSQGALFAQNLLCNRSETFKAIASIGAPMSQQLSQSCEITEPTSYMMIHGTADSVLPYKGLQHSNFGLISAPDAIALLAGQNKSLASPLIKGGDGWHLQAYTNGQQKTHLYTVEGGGHSWSHKNFDTSNQVFNFFSELQQAELPNYSSLVDIGDKKLHVREMGEANQGPSIVLISGFNKNYHADSAWFSLLQPVLAEHYHVLVVDRAGNAWSDFDKDVSFQTFADDLALALQALKVKDVVLVPFASANITAQFFANKLFANKSHEGSELTLKAMVWVDPDILLPFSIQKYQGYPVDWYVPRIEPLLPYLAEGNWTERSQNKIAAEKQHVVNLVADKWQKQMDWDYFNLVTERRALVSHQQTRALEIAHYHDDLNAVATLPVLSDIPISVVDGDFEQQDLIDFPDDKEAILQWIEEGTAWSKMVSEQTGGYYIPLENSDHLIPLQYPEIVKEALEQLLE